MQPGRTALALTTWLLLPIASLGQETASADALAEKAEALFAYEDGGWESRWEFLDAQGEVVREMEGTEVFSYEMDGRAVRLETRSEGEEGWSLATRFYSPQEGKIIFLSWSTEGEYWIMKQDPESEVVRSEPKTMPDGRELILRFTSLRKTENEQDVVMEYSYDGGETWTLRTRQYMRRANG